MQINEPASPPGSGSTDEIFQAMISAPDLRSVDDAGDREGLRRDIRRIASSVFCSADIDPSIVTFAKTRTALHWDLTEDAVDVMVTARLLKKTASLIRDLGLMGEWLRGGGAGGTERRDPTAVTRSSV